MAPIEPIPDPGTQKPQVYNTVTCPHCGKVNKVTQYQVLKGFKCSGCGQRIDGITGGKPGPDGPYPVIEEIVCPQCKSGSNLEHLSDNAERKRFRCKTCGIEF